MSRRRLRAGLNRARVHVEVEWLLLLTERNGTSRYRTMFFVHRDSPIRNLSGLRGHTLALQDPGSTSGYQVPMITLLDNGLVPGILAGPGDRPGADRVGYLFARSQLNVAVWVHKRMVDAGAIGPKVTNVNEAALGRLETLLALVEGWVDAVVTAAVGDRLPSADKLRETWLRRRATGGAAEQAFSSLVGLELRPRLAREASELWRRVGEAVGTERRDGLWHHPDLLPVGEDLENPAAVIDRLLDESTGDSSGVDEIEKFLRDAGGEAGQGGAPSDGPKDEV